MAKVLVTEAYLNDIADAIRAKNGGSATYKPGQMAGAIAALPDAPVLVAKSITANGEYDPEDDNADGYSGVTVNVPSSQPNLQSKTVTQNGTVTPDQGYDGLSSVVVDVSGGRVNDLDFDFTQSIVDSVRGVTPVNNSVVQSSIGLSFSGTSSYIRLNKQFSANGWTYEIDVGSTAFTSGDHRRFIMGDGSDGFIYRSSGVWAFYADGWVESTETDPTFFNNSTIKVFVDNSGYWHIYKNGMLWWEPSLKFDMDHTNSRLFTIGSTEQSSPGLVITGLRVY